MKDYELRLLKAFPNSFINCHGEFIAHKKGNEYFILKNCESELDVKCKVLEWFSRGAFKSEPYRRRKDLNDKLHKFMLDGINNYLGTNFTHADMLKIYCPLGNACNHSLTIKFIESGYDFDVLKKGE